ncbi:NADH ubiquinone oxidoreductase subunit NDUFA12 [Actinopolyspora erythraea]|uniref:NADH dehydrogenase n=1 Tax=Actinopolyspora erythraea TaxID=414996 RepID=A0A099D343_9ACTN|nr:hydrogen gas-evolving membrane-bound hydrogenase subunit E [Actinopolyspora erythraea]ASU77551.1 NADH ubiquinone oxidoreductase subunit NDUFA12 [Actinopolyspora erythraea]KGI80454.1 NADH dehydrogenase [Actinopolyspora erythraea]
MLALVVSHLLVALVLSLVSMRHSRAIYPVAALPPAAALCWALAHADPVLAGSPPVTRVSWSATLGLEFAFRLDTLALVMTLLVSGIGVLVLLYSRWYFGTPGGDAKRSAPLLLAFAGVMLGLVLADDLLTLYVFWELTTICSFLLVGQSGVSRESRRASLQALLVTALGGLVMLLGFIVLGESSGTYRISELAADPPEGAAAAAATGLILVGAFTKSAQVPFHNWLPAAMVAPTPISAYLHAASMVKAGVFLIARLTPVLSEVSYLPVVTAVFGLVTMFLGGWRALREHDLKLLLAYGTVSQLGFLMVLAGSGSYTGELALAGMLLAHGAFKATLFLVIGIVDHQTGTRDIRELSGVGRRLPWVASVAVLAAMSMAGVPPTIGFVAKEAAFEAYLGTGAAVVAEAGIVAGSVLTVAYTARLLFGCFASKRGAVPTEAHPAPVGMLLPPAVTALVCLVLGVAYPLTDELAATYAERAVGHSGEYHLALWHGFNPPLVLSAVTLLAGLTLAVHNARLNLLRSRLPKPLDAQRGYERIMGSLERLAVGVTGRVQVGSLPTYLGIILLAVLVVPGSVLLVRVTPIEQLRWWDNVLQLPLALVILVAAAGVVRATRRITAVLLVGVIGYGIGGMFIVGGGPDLALTQFLVETLTLIAFVLVLRRLPARFTETPSARRVRLPKVLISLAGGVFVGFAALIFSSARDTPSRVSAEYLEHAEEGTSATNVVNAIIVDFRAFDTVGELSVLAVTATGVASLVLSARSARRRKHARSDWQKLSATPRSTAGEHGERGRA